MELKKFYALLGHMQWFEAADLIVKGMEGEIAAKTATYNFERLRRCISRPCRAATVTTGK